MATKEETALLGRLARKGSMRMKQHHYWISAVFAALLMLTSSACLIPLDGSGSGGSWQRAGSTADVPKGAAYLECPGCRTIQFIHHCNNCKHDVTWTVVPEFEQLTCGNCSMYVMYPKCGNCGTVLRTSKFRIKE